MQVSESDGRLFYELFVGLQLLVNRRHRVLEGVETFEAFMALPPEQRLECRRLLYAHPEHFDEYLEEGDLSASPDAPEIIAGWRDHRVEGQFFVLRHLKRHSIFLTSDSPRGPTASSGSQIRSRRSSRTRPPWSRPCSSRCAARSSTTASC